MYEVNVLTKGSDGLGRIFQMSALVFRRCSHYSYSVSTLHLKDQSIIIEQPEIHLHP